MTYEWASPRKAIEYYVDYLIPKKEDSEYHLYKAVIEGRIRVMCGGRLLTKEETAAFAARNWSPLEGDFYALPADISLCVEDVKRELGDWQPGDPRATKPRHGV